MDSVSRRWFAMMAWVNLHNLEKKDSLYEPSYPQVFDSPYNGFSTDELFFFNHDFGGPPWEPESKALSQK